MRIFITQIIRYYVIRKIDGTTGIITTIAGTGKEGNYGTSGDGGPAILANVYYQMGICIDSKKNIYISDLGIPRIRKIDAVTGIINTIAGDGNSDADSILAINAILKGFVRSVSVDSANNVYVGSRAYCRKIDATTGVITTIVGNSSIPATGFSGDGGSAILAKTNASGGMFIDKYRNIFVSDHNNYRVRKVSSQTGIIKTIGGNGGTGIYNGDNILATDASLNNPQSVSIDNDSNIYIGDVANYRIRKISSASGIISTIAGNGTAGFSADGTLATSAQITVSKVRTDLQNNVYFYDGNYRIRKINAVTGIITTVAGNCIAGFSGDGNAAIAASILGSDFCVDSYGNILIADGANYRVRKVEAATGIISTIAGTGVRARETYAGDGGVATGATLGLLYSICADNNKNIYIGDLNFAVVRKIDASTGIITTVAGYFTSGNAAVDGTIATAGYLRNLSSIFVDAEGNLYLQEGAAIRKVEKATGIITTIAGNKIPGFSGDGGLATNAQFYFGSFTLDKSGTNLLIEDGYNNRIRKVLFNNIVFCPGTGNKIITSNISGAAYQWEMNNGNGFVPITDNANYTGTNSASLQLINPPSEWTGYQFRCITDEKYSNVFTLQFIAQWTGVVDKTWSNITNWACSIPDANTDVVISTGNNIVVDVNATIRSLQISPGATLTVAPGINFTILH